MPADHLMLLSAIGDVQTFVWVFVTVYSLIIFLYILTSWIRLPYNRLFNVVQRFLYDACEPYLRLFRRLIPPLGRIDLSPVIAVFVLIVVGEVINAVLGTV
jgi:YggT family protein